MEIELGGRYVERRVAERLERDGGEPLPDELVKILHVGMDLCNGQSVVAMVYGQIGTYFSDGRFLISDTGTGSDLVPVPAPRRSVTVYGNCYSSGMVYWYNTRKDADVHADPSREACVTVTATWAPGEGL
jgi:hypothetical protein